ncbi:MAG TPA: hypothetical protein VIT45_08535 [Allosphingosinicella sp.]
MEGTKEALYREWIASQLRDERNEDVYERRLTAAPPTPGFESVPGCIYFYYVRIDRDGMVRADHFFYPNGPAESPEDWKPIPYAEMADPEGIVKKLALDARPSGGKKYKLPSDSFKDVVWKHRSYIVFFFDEKHWSFHRRDGNKPSVAFNVSEGRDPNRSFFDANDMSVEMPVRARRRNGETSDERTAIFLVNHLKDTDDTDLREGVVRKYKFDMYLRVKYARRDAEAMTVILDPDGSNQGPNT